jgi:putative membrane protein
MERNCDRGKFPTAIIAIVAAVIAVAVILVAAFAYLSSTNPNYGYGNGYYGGGYGGMMGGFGGFGMLFMIPIGLIVLLIIGYVIWRGCGWGGGSCGGGHTGHYSSNGNRENALEIIRQRYARGEISKEQFEQMKKDVMA